MTQLTERLRDRFFPPHDHPYQVFVRELDASLTPALTILDAGCGRTAPLLQRFKGRAKRLIGIDLTDFAAVGDGVELIRRDLAATGLDDDSVDIVYARSVMEHLREPALVYREISRILRPGGRFVLITANRWDYVSVAARVIPNSWHPWFVVRTEGRDEHDVFPTVYRTNTSRDIERLGKDAGLIVEDLRYLGQYPSYFMFNAALFLAATAYEKVISRVDSLRFLRSWIYASLRKPPRSNSA